MIRIGALIIFGAMVYFIGYNSGSNNGYAIALKVAPECRSTTIYIVFDE